MMMNNFITLELKLKIKYNKTRLKMKINKEGIICFKLIVILKNTKLIGKMIIKIQQSN